MYPPRERLQNMCVYCLTLSNLKPFNITHLFQGSVITFNPPMLVMDYFEFSPANY